MAFFLPTILEAFSLRKLHVFYSVNLQVTHRSLFKHCRVIGLLKVDLFSKLLAVGRSPAGVLLPMLVYGWGKPGPPSGGPD